MLLDSPTCRASLPDRIRAHYHKLRTSARPCEEVVEHASMLNVDLVVEPELQWIAEEFWQAQLPEGWEEYQDSQGQTFYSHAEKALSQWEHPLQRYYHGLVWMVKKGNALLERRRRGRGGEDTPRE